MFTQKNHVDPSVSSSTSPPTRTPELSPEEINLFSLAMQEIFDEEPSVKSDSLGAAVR